MQSVQELIDLIDQVPFDQYLEEDLDAIPEEAAQAWSDQTDAITARGEELGCDVDEGSFVVDRVGELTFQTRSGEQFIKNNLTDDEG